MGPVPACACWRSQSRAHVDGLRTHDGPACPWPILAHRKQLALAFHVRSSLTFSGSSARVRSMTRVLTDTRGRPVKYPLAMQRVSAVQHLLGCLIRSVRCAVSLSAWARL
eukprot:6198109-Pleurochrysis_carterae.AAC.3